MTLVHIVDDDADSAAGVQLILKHAGLDSETYGTGEDFLERFEDTLESARCLLLDIRMPGMSGLGLLKELAIRKISIPTIVFSGYTEVPLAVEAMKSGAVDVLEKPIHAQILLQRVQAVLDRDSAAAPLRARAAAYRTRKQSLSDREAQVLELLLQGENAKRIAAHFNLNVKTVMKYRAQVLEKMEVANLVELIRMGPDDLVNI